MGRPVLALRFFAPGEEMELHASKTGMDVFY